jgi:hypothetical protein
MAGAGAARCFVPRSWTRLCGCASVARLPLRFKLSQTSPTAVPARNGPGYGTVKETAAEPTCDCEHFLIHRCSRDYGMLGQTRFGYGHASPPDVSYRGTTRRLRVPRRFACEFGFRSLPTQASMRPVSREMKSRTYRAGTGVLPSATNWYQFASFPETSRCSWRAFMHHFEHPDWIFEPKLRWLPHLGVHRRRIHLARFQDGTTSTRAALGRGGAPFPKDGQDLREYESGKYMASSWMAWASLVPTRYVWAYPSRP